MSLQSAAAMFYNTTELVEYTLTFCSLRELVAWAQTHRRARIAVASAKRRQWFLILREFVGTGLARFLHLLNKHESVVVGSVALALVTGNVAWVPAKLSVVIPRGEVGVFLVHFIAEGYVLRKEQDGKRENRLAGRRKLYQLWHAQKKKRIWVIESISHSVYPPLLSLSTTAAMNFVTSTTIYSLYPVLTSDNRALVGFHGATARTIINMFLRRILVAEDTSFFKTACRLACPAILRRTKGLVGVGRVRWTDGEVHNGALDYIENESYQWSLSHGCCNDLCPYNADVM